MKVRCKEELTAVIFELGMEDGYRYSPALYGFTHDVIRSDSPGYDIEQAMSNSLPSPVQITAVILTTEREYGNRIIRNVRIGDYIVTLPTREREVYTPTRFHQKFEVVLERKE